MIYNSCRLTIKQFLVLAEGLLTGPSEATRKMTLGSRIINVYPKCVDIYVLQAQDPFGSHSACIVRNVGQKIDLICRKSSTNNQFIL